MPTTHELGWVMIPPTILAAADLCMGEKVVCGRVVGLVGKKGYCFASNEWLGSQLGYSDRTIEDYISKLTKKGYLRREYGANGKRDRRLYPIPEIAGKGIPIPEIAGSHPCPGSEPSLLEQGSLIGVSVENSVESSKTPSSDKPRAAMPKEALDGLTEHYAKIRGARPRDNAWLPIQQGFRQMVAVEGYSPEQVTGCMDRLVKLGWTWTINTVRKWIADYVAGTMPSENGKKPQTPNGRPLGEYDAAVKEA